MHTDTAGTYEAKAIALLRQRLISAYPASTQTDIDTTVDHALATFTDARVRDFIPLLVEREARTELDKTPA